MDWIIKYFNKNMIFSSIGISVSVVRSESNIFLKHESVPLPQGDSGQN